MNVSVRVGRNMLYNAIAKFSLLLGNLVVLSIYSHYLGSDEFGVIALMSVIMLFYSLFFLGVPQTLIKQISHYAAIDDNEQVQRSFNNGVLAIFATGFTICIALVGLAPLILSAAIRGRQAGANGGAVEFIAYVTVANLFLYTLYVPIDSALQGYQRYGTIAIRTVISTCCGWILMLGAVLLDTGLQGVAIATLGQPFVILIISYFSFRSLKLRFEPRRYFDTAVMRSLFGIGFPLFINDALAVLLTRSDVFIVSFFWSIQYVGYYTAAVTLALYSVIIPRLFVGSLLVSMSELHAQGDYDRIVSGCRKAARYLILIVTPLTIALCGFSQSLLTTLFPKDFEAAVPVLVLLAIAYWPIGVTAPCTAVLIGITAPRQLTANTGVMVVSILTALLLLVPNFGIIGAGAANLVMIPPHLFLFWQVSRTITKRGRPTRMLEVFPLKTIFTAIGASLLAVGASWLALQGIKPFFDSVLPDLSFKLVVLIVGGIVGGPIYLFSLAFLVRELEADDWRLVNRIVNLDRLLGRFRRNSAKSVTAPEVAFESNTIPTVAGLEGQQTAVVPTSAPTATAMTTLFEPTTSQPNPWDNARTAIFASLDAAMKRQVVEIDNVLDDLKRQVEAEAQQAVLSLNTERENLQREVAYLRREQAHLKNEIGTMQRNLEEVANQKQTAEYQVQDMLRASEEGRARIQREMAYLTTQMDDVGHQMQSYVEQQFSQLWEEFIKSLESATNRPVSPSSELYLTPGPSDDKKRLIS